MNLTARSLLRPVLIWLLLVVWVWAVFRRPLALGQAVGLSLLLVLLATGAGRWLRARERRFIQSYALPSFLFTKLRVQHPQLDDSGLRAVERGLRQFFLVSAAAQGRFVAMPSRVADTLWHEFILHTRAYETFCQRAFGQLLHHTPAEALAMDPDGRRSKAQSPVIAAGLRQAWEGCCREERLPLRKPPRLPLLFALDTMLAIAGGYRYVLDCNAPDVVGGGDTYCATHVACGSGDGSSGSADGDGGDGGGGGDGCGGGGCGGD